MQVMLNSMREQLMKWQEEMMQALFRQFGQAGTAGATGAQM